MGKENDVVLEYLDGNQYFADLFNGSYFDGDPVVMAGKLTNLICVNEIEDFSKYHTSLKLLLMLLANRKSKKKMKKMMEESQEFKNVDKETALAAGKLLGINVVMEKTLEQEGEEIDMCTGLKEWLLEERSEGRTEGISLMSKLALKLNEDGRLNDLVKAAMDSEYQQKLLLEYNLE